MKLLLAIIPLLAALNAQASSLHFDSSVPAEVASAMDADLATVVTINGQGSSPLHRQIFGRVDGKSYEKWFSDRIQNVRYRSDLNTPYVASNSGGGWMNLFDNFVNGKIPQVARIMILFHEARHSDPERNGYEHERCPNPFLDAQGKEKLSIISGQKLRGLYACDSTAIGSYGATSILLTNISRFCETCTEKFKQDAELYAQDQTIRLLNPVDVAALKADSEAE